MLLKFNEEERVGSETLQCMDLQIPGIPFDGASEGRIEAMYPS